MDPWTEGIQKILDRAPSGALQFSRLVEELRLEGLAVEGREQWILRRISDAEERFRLIPDRRRLHTRWLREYPPPVHGSGGLPRRDPWVVPLRAAPSCHEWRGSVARLQEGLRAWGRELDEGSGIAVARWIRANEEGERVCLGLTRQRGSRPP